VFKIAIDQHVDHRGCDEIKKLKSFDIIGKFIEVKVVTLLVAAPIKTSF